MSNKDNKDFLEPIAPGEILREDFLEPMGRILNNEFFQLRKVQSALHQPGIINKD